MLSLYDADDADYMVTAFLGLPRLRQEVSVSLTARGSQTFPFPPTQNAASAGPLPCFCGS